jgi:hypothetical protein
MKKDNVQKGGAPTSIYCKCTLNRGGVDVGVLQVKKKVNPGSGPP